MEKKVIDLEIVEDLEQSGVFAISLVDVPAIEKNWMAFKKEVFVDPGAGESEDEFIPRCIAKLVGDEGYETDQAAAICYSTYREKAAIEPNPCWEGYEPYGLKDDGTPNCIPVKSKAEKFAETYTDYPEAAVNNAKRALAWAEENGWGDCGMGPGKARANQLANREPISEDTIARMSAFQRHKQNSDTPYGEGCGKLMWDAWGGDAGVEWAERKLKQIRKEEMSIDVSGLPPYVDQVPKKKKDKFALQGIPLPRGQKVVLQAEDEDYDRGLVVELLQDGGYNVEYWFNEPTNIEPAEVEVDGETITDSARLVYIGYHPELEDYAFSIHKNKKFAFGAEEKPVKMVFASEDQRVVIGPAMIPDMEILRKDQKTKEPYYVKFSKETIAKIAEKFMRELRNGDTNIEHDEANEANSYVKETWIVETEDDKANTKYGLNVPVGTWMVSMRVQDPKVWKKIKAGELNGFSIEGNFMSKEDYEAYKKDRETYDRIMKILKSI
jgi:hypothetical protein